MSFIAQSSFTIATPLDVRVQYKYSICIYELFIERTYVHTRTTRTSRLQVHRTRLPIKQSKNAGISAQRLSIYCTFQFRNLL